jgi:hypothetical protein
MNFVIRSEGGRVLTFHSRTIRENGWVESYFVTAEAPNFHASLQADNPPFGTSPAQFFAEIAADWAGWADAKTWGAIEGEYTLSATSDSTGHITLITHLHGSPYPLTWEGKLALVLEAGALGALSNQANDFFAPVRAETGA